MRPDFSQIAGDLPPEQKGEEKTPIVSPGGPEPVAESENETEAAERELAADEGTIDAASLLGTDATPPVRREAPNKIKAKRSNEDFFTESLDGYSLEVFAEDWGNNQALIDALLEDANADQLKRWRLEIITVTKDGVGQPLSDDLRKVKVEILDKINAKLATLAPPSTPSTPTPTTVTSPTVTGPGGAQETEQGNGEVKEETPEAEKPITSEQIDERSKAAREQIEKLIAFEQQADNKVKHGRLGYNDLTILIQLNTQLTDVRTVGEYKEVKNEIIDILARYGYGEVIGALFR